MQYTSAVLLVQGCSGDEVGAIYSHVLGQALNLVMPRGSLDVWVCKTPPSIDATHRLVLGMYEHSRAQAKRVGREQVCLRVLLDGHDFEPDRPQTWEVIMCSQRESELAATMTRVVPPTSTLRSLSVVILGSGNVLTRDSSYLNCKMSIAKTENGNHSDAYDEYGIDARINSTDDGVFQQYSIVAVGGTFDHLHDGHRLLLTISGYLARDELVIGLTGPELLKNKKYAEAMQSYRTRRDNVEEFVSYVFPSLKITIVMINDVYGPTATMREIEALVVSKETAAGAEQINKYRREQRQFPELEVFIVDLVGLDKSSDMAEKLSSTELRRNELQSKGLL